MQVGERHLPMAKKPATTASPPTSKPTRRGPRRIVLDEAAPLAGTAAMPLLVDGFLDHIRHERALATNTLEAYRRDLADFSSWLDGRDCIRLSPSDLGDYLAWLHDRGLSRLSMSPSASCFSRVMTRGGAAHFAPSGLSGGRTICGAFSGISMEKAIHLPSGDQLKPLGDRWS